MAELDAPHTRVTPPCPNLLASPPAPSRDRRRQLPPAHGMLSHRFERAGSGLCGGWSAAERDKLTRDARFTLRGFGFTMVPEVRS